MPSVFRQVISGHRPLPATFWGYAVAGGLAVNAVLSAAALFAVAMAAPTWLFLTLHLAPIPYNLVMLVAVWNSASRYDGPLLHSLAARAAIIPWTMLLCVV